jgi:hypothetical protein
VYLFTGIDEPKREAVQYKREVLPLEQNRLVISVVIV